MKGDTSDKDIYNNTVAAIFIFPFAFAYLEKIMSLVLNESRLSPSFFLQKGRPRVVRSSSL